MNKLTVKIIICDETGRKIGERNLTECGQFTDSRTGKVKHDFLLHFNVEEYRADWCKFKTKGG